MRLVAAAQADPSPAVAVKLPAFAVDVSQEKQRVLDFDIETVAAGFADPDWVPQKITCVAWSWIGTDKVESRICGPTGIFGDPSKRRTMLEPLLAAIGEADIVTGHNVCMVPETRVLTSDLQWVEAGDLEVGDRLLSFEEHLTGPRRKLEFATVLGNRLDRDEVWAVELETGEILYATADHPWLVGTQSGPGARHRWRRTDELLGTSGVSPKKPALLYKVLEPWTRDTSWGSGWLSGFFDGEGTLAGSNASKASLVASQNPGPSLDRCMELLRERRFAAAAEPSRRATDPTQRMCRRIRVNGGFQEKTRFLGQVRPARLLANWEKMEPGALRALASVAVRSVTPVGVREVSRLATSSSTYIAEGYAVHNCRFDLPILNAECMRLGLEPIRSVLIEDTMKLVRSKGFKKGQDNLAVLYQVDEKKLSLSWQEWQDAYDEDGWGLIRQRCESDVVSHKQIREQLRRAGYLKPPRMWRA